jgi:hypothetical protein
LNYHILIEMYFASLFISFTFIIQASAHSWVECVDYTGPTDVYDKSKCRALPRVLSDGRGPGVGSGIFGLDIGMDHRPANKGSQCQGSVNRGLQANYPKGVASYEVGKTYTLAWPPKNHVAASCTNQHIPDHGVNLFVAPHTGVSDPSVFTQTVSASFSDQRHKEHDIDFLGFQNCPKFCDDADKSLCTGTFTVPNLPDGTYTFQWNWAFNSPTDNYTTCWEATVSGGSGSGPTTTTTTTTTLPQSSIGNWQSGMKLTHFWDCNGMGCDATVLQPWDLDKYVASPGYSPQDPNDFGGSVYGEKMWVVGAASDTLADMLGEDDGCCGSDTASKGCGKCALIRVPSATNSDWTALIMKKNRCPPNSNGCGAGNAHFDVAVPGYDNLQFSTANICGQRDGTGFASRQDSAVLGDWYNSYQNTAQAVSRCSSLPLEFQKGCQLFSEWGWTRGDPSAEYQVVDCPSAFKDYIADQFDENGVVVGTTTSVPETTIGETSLSSTTTTTADSSTDGPGVCFIAQCGCPDHFKENWCTINDHKYSDSFCATSQANCETCNGAWCPFDGPGGPATTTPTPVDTTLAVDTTIPIDTTLPVDTTDLSGEYVSLDFNTQISDFTFGQSVTIESDSLRFETSTANFGKGFLKSQFSVPGDHWGRVWMKMDSISLTSNLGHWVAIAGGVGGNQIRMMDINSNEAGKVVFQLGWQDDAFQKVTSWSNKYSLSTEWTCYEWHMDPNAQTFDFYVSGNAVTWDSPNGIGSNVPSGRQLPQTLDWIGFGVESFGGAGTTIGGNFDNIEVASNRVGCGAAPEATTTTTSTTFQTTTISSSSSTSSTTTSTTTVVPTTLKETTIPSTDLPTTTVSTCGYVPPKCSKPLQKNFDKLSKKTFKKFKKVTGVSQSDATIEDMQLYFYCKGKSKKNCGGIEAPCTCSNPPCICPGDIPNTTPSTTTIASTTTTSTTSTTTAPTTTTLATTKGTTKSSLQCANSQCGCDLSGASWCTAENMWVSSGWCQESSGNCQNCNGVWCGSDSSNIRRLLKQY